MGLSGPWWRRKYLFRWCLSVTDTDRQHHFSHNYCFYVLFNHCIHNELHILTDNGELCFPFMERPIFMTEINSRVRRRYVMYGQKIGRVVGRFQESLIKSFLVSTSFIEYDDTTTVGFYVFPINIWSFVWNTAKIHRRMTECCSVLWTTQYSRRHTWSHMSHTIIIHNYV